MTHLLPAKTRISRAIRLHLFAVATLLLLNVSNFAKAQVDRQREYANSKSPRLAVELPNNSNQSSESYAAILYEVVIPNELGPLKQQVRQPLPLRDQTVASAAPISTAMREQIDSTRILQPYDLFRPGKKIAVDEHNRVLLCEVGSERESVLMNGPTTDELRFASKFPKTTLSPSGRFLAVAMLSGQDDAAAMSPPLYDIYVIDLFIPVVSFPKSLDELGASDKYQPKKICQRVRGVAVLGSAWFPHASGPAMVWADEKTLIYVSSEPKQVDESDDRPRDDQLIFIGTDGLSYVLTHRLLGLNVESLAEQDFGHVKLQSTGGGLQLGNFWRRSDGAIMLRNYGRDIRLDLEHGKHEEDRRLSPNYELRGDHGEPSLWYGDQVLCERLCYRHVSVSPDGRSVAWYARSQNARDKTNLGNTSQYPTTLWFHSLETGVINMAEGMFVTPNTPFSIDTPPFGSGIRWELSPQ